MVPVKMQAITDPQTLPLRDIHLPATVSWWPPALSWWLLTIGLLMLTALLIYAIRYWYQYRHSALYLAQQQLKKIIMDHDRHQDKTILIKQLSELLRRISISVFKRADTASLTGEDWLKFLDKCMDNNEFQHGVGRVLITAPYQPKVNYDDLALLQLVQRWINTIAKGRYYP